jgi:hypothetical protein
LYRRQASSGFTATNISPENPFTFEMGAYRVPDNMELFIMDMRPDVYRFGSISPSDFQPVHERSLSNILGFALTIDQKTHGNIDFQLEPAPIVQSAQHAYPGGSGLTNQVQTVYGVQTVPYSGGATTLDFSDAQADSFANTAGPGIALQPQRPERYGARDLPFTLYAKSGQTVQVKCIIWHPIPIPIAFIEYTLSGIELPQLMAHEMVKAVDYPRQGP